MRQRLFLLKIRCAKSLCEQLARRLKNSASKKDVAARKNAGRATARVARRATSPASSLPFPTANPLRRSLTATPVAVTVDDSPAVDPAFVAAAGTPAAAVPDYSAEVNQLLNRIFSNCAKGSVEGAKMGCEFFPARRAMKKISRKRRSKK